MCLACQSGARRVLFVALQTASEERGMSEWEQRQSCLYPGQSNSSLRGLWYSSHLKMGNGPLCSVLTQVFDMLIGPMCCNVMLVKNCSVHNQIFFSHRQKMSCTFMLCIESCISCLRFEQAIQRTSGLAVGASEAAGCSQIGRGRI